MNVLKWASAAGVALVSVVFDRPAEAQVLVAPAPVVSYYYAPAAPVVAAPVPAVVAPTVSYYTVPAPVPVSYYVPAAPVVAAPVAVAPSVATLPTVPATSGYYAPVSVTYPVRISRGLFGRTIIRSPFGVTKY